MERFYNNLLVQLESKEFKIKPGEFIKMVELTVKLTPTRSEQQEFWEHIDKIRREHFKKLERAKPGQITRDKTRRLKKDGSE